MRKFTILLTLFFCLAISQGYAQNALGLSFDGVNDRATIPFNSAYNRGTTGTYTIEAWIKADATQPNAEPTIFSNREAANPNTGIQVFLLNGKLTMRIGGTVTTSVGNDLRDGNCHHIAVRRANSGTPGFFIDGVYYSGGSGFNQNVNTTHDVWIGLDEPTAATSRFKGVIHELRFWNVAQSNQIGYNLHSYLAGNETSLIGYWRMNDNVQTLDDLTTVNNNGYLGTTTSVETADPVYVAGCMCSTTAAINSSGGTVICNAAGLALNATTGAGLSYQWKLNGQGISGATSSSYNALTAGVYTCLIYTPTCGNTSNAITLTATNPTVNIAFGGSQYICVGGSSLLNSSVSNAGTPTYQWKLNGNNIAGATGTTYTATQTGTYTLLVTNTTNGCSALSGTSLVLTVFSSAPSSAISFTGSSSSCNGVPMQITGGSTNGYTYQWQLNGSNISGQTSNLCYAYTSGQYRCAVTNACGTTYTNTLNPLITGTGAITYTGNTTLCTGTLQLVATYIQGAAYQWYHDGNLINGANNSAYTASGAGVYNCQIITDDCGIVYSSNSVTMDGAPFISANGPLDFCTGGVTLKANGGTTATGYQWKNNGVSINGATASTYVAATSGSYSCEVVSTLCGTKLSNALTVTAGVPTPVSVLYGTSSFNSYMDVCNGAGSILAVPCCAGTYTMRDLMTGFTIISQPNNDFYAPGTGYYLIELDNGCGVTQTNSFGVRNMGSMHSVLSDGATSFCSSATPPNLYVGTNNFPFGPQVYGPAWDTYVWKLNGVVIPNGPFPVPIQPTQTGWYSCTVSNSCGTAVYVDSLYITVSQAPSTNVTASGSLTFCQGQSVTFNVTPTTGATYQWVRNGLTINGATSTSYTATTAGTYKVYLTNGNCNGIYSADQIVTITYPFTPVVTCNNPTILCSGQTATLLASTGAGYNYVWSLNGTVIGGATSSSYVANTSGNYSVKITDANGCYNTSTNMLLTSGLHSANITTANANPVCQGSFFSLTSNASGSDITGTQWKLNGVAISGATGSGYGMTTTLASAGSYTVDITNACGTFTSAPYVLNVNPLPTTPVVSASGNNFFCTTGSVTLNSTTQTGVTYQWHNPGVISGATSSSYVANAPGGYYVWVTSTSGCTVISNTVNVYSTGFSPSISPVVSTACTPFVLTASPSTGVTYQWKSGNSNISGATSVSYSPGSSGSYTCTMTGACGSSTSNVVNLQELYSAPLNAAGVIIYPDTTTSCGGQSIRIAVNRFVLPPYVNQSTRQWKLNGVAIPGATNTTYYATVSGNYTLDITVACGTTTSNVATLTFNPSPTATITASGSTNLCNGTSVTLNANTGTGLTYQWTTNGQVITGATSASHTTNVGGTYRCIVSNSSGCSVTSNFINVFTSTGTAPTASITPSGTVNICTGSTQTLTANTGSGYTYQWKKNGTNISGATSLTYGATTAGAYTVVVTSACGSATSSATTVNVSSTITATITPAGPTTVCSGSVVLNANTGTGLTYQWKNNGSNVAGATTASYTATTSGSYTVVVTATGGCSATSAATVVTIGALTAALTPAGPASICAGTAITMSATTGTGYIYQWYRNNVLLSITTATYSTTSGGTYKCVVTSGSCTATTNSVVVTQITNPTPTVTYTSPLSFCSPGSVTLTANTFAGATFQWENNSVPIAGATSQNYVATGPGLYRCNETANGCSRYTSKVSVSAATAAVAAISTNDPTTLCSGGTVNMTVSNPIPGYSYQWKKNTVVIAGATATSYAATATGSYTVTATASCGTATSNAIAVSIGSFAAQVTPAGNVTLCTGGSLLLTANTGTGFTYQWKKNNVNIAGATSATYSVTTAGSYTVAMTSPCGNGTSAATVVSQNTVTASLTPAGTSTVCSGTAQTFTANAGTGYTYRWYRNNVLLSVTTQTYTTTSDGSYKVEVSIGGSCALLSNTAVLTVINNPTPTITASGPTTFCAGQSVTFTANTFAGVTYQWQKNSVNIAGATSQSYTATTAGTYRANETANGCSKFTPKQTVTVNCRIGQDGTEISTDETNSTVTMEVYPNPFADKLNIEITSPITEQTVIKVMDVLGKVQYTQMITTNATTELNTKLPAGIYMINAVVDGQMKTLRVVKTK